MNFLLIEFLGVFFLVFFRSLSNISVEVLEVQKEANAFTTGFLILIFSILSKDLSKGMFNPSFAIVQSIFKKISVHSALGYITVHIIASLFAISLLTLLLPYHTYLDNPELNIGVKILNESNDNFSLFTIECVGSMLLFIGYLYFQDNDEYQNLGIGSAYYGMLTTGLSLATYQLTGGAYNLSLIIGGILFDNTYDIKLISLFIGNLFGCFIGKLIYLKIISEKIQKRENKTLKLLLNK